MNKLLLDPENGRFLHLKLKGKGELSQADLNDEMWNEDATITLSKAIAREGILNPIVVFPTKGVFLVVDGNRRTVTLRRLIHEGVKPPEGVSFDVIPAYVIPPDTPKAKIEILKGILQEGQRPWGAFNNAAYTRRLRVEYKMEFEDIADSLQLSVKKVKLRIENFRLFEAYAKASRDTDPSRFSYFADAPPKVKAWYDESEENLLTYFELINPRSPRHKIRSVSTKGGLREFKKIVGHKEALKEVIENPKVTVEDALEMAMTDDILLSAPFLKKIGTWAAKLKSLDGAQIDLLQQNRKLRLDLGRLKDAAESLVNRLKRE